MKDAVKRSEIWNEKLGVGKPYDTEIDLRLENWILLQVATSDEKAALQKKITAPFDPEFKRAFYVTDLITALVLRETGKKDEADALMKKFDNGLEGAWCKAYYNGTPDAKKRSPYQGSSDFRLLQKMLIK